MARYHLDAEAIDTIIYFCKNISLLYKQYFKENEQILSKMDLNPFCILFSLHLADFSVKIKFFYNITKQLQILLGLLLALFLC